MIASTAAPEPDAPPRRAHLAWQQRLGGELRWAPLALADGALLVVDHGDGSELRRLDGDGAVLWSTRLGGRASGAPVRTDERVAIPLDGRRVVVHATGDGARARPPLALPGLAPKGSIAALRGHVLARFASPDGQAAPFLAMLDLAAPGAAPRLVPDPLAHAPDARFRATNHTFVVAGEPEPGRVTVLGLDAQAERVLWRHDLDGALAHLWAAGGLVDVVLSDRVSAFEARTGLALTTRFDGMILDEARIAGESLLAVIGDPGDPETRDLMSFDAMTEEPTGQHRGFLRVVGAGSDEVLVADLDDRPALLDLPSLEPIPIRDGASIVGPSLVAWSRHRAWVVAHEGHSLSAIDL